jgi:hypothetical protein
VPAVTAIAIGCEVLTSSSSTTRTGLIVIRPTRSGCSTNV